MGKLWVDGFYTFYFILSLLSEVLFHFLKVLYCSWSTAVTERYLPTHAILNLIEGAH